MNPPRPTGKFFGQINIRAWFCALVKGQGKVAWEGRLVDPNRGKMPRKYTAITLRLTPLPEAGTVYPIERTVVAEFGEWPEIILPSLRKCAISNLKQLDRRWVCLEIVLSGYTYVDKHSGKRKEATTLRFLHVFADEGACRTGWKAVQSKQYPQPGFDLQGPHRDLPGKDAYQTAVKFLRPYVANAWRKSSGNLAGARAILAALIANQPCLAAHFTIDSPEVWDEFARFTEAG